MSIDQNLMGLGLPAALAVRIATGGTGPVTIAASSGGTQIGGKQFVVFIGSGTGSVKLPVVGGSDTAPEVADDYVIHNGTGSTATVTIPTGVTVNLSGTTGITGSFTLATGQTATMWVVSTTQWFGIRN